MKITFKDERQMEISLFPITGMIQYKCQVNIILWFSTLPPWRLRCVKKKNLFKDTSTMVGTHN